MASSFGVVEDKLREAEFFLSKLRDASHMSFEANCYFSAFVSSARSVTFAMQASLKGVPGFEDWYDGAQKRLKTDPLAPFFVEIRNEVVHTGANPLNRVSLDHLHEDLARQLRGDRRHVIVLPNAQLRNSTNLVDAVEACERYFTSLVSVVYECYLAFKSIVDARWHFTEANFRSLTKSFEDALVELGFPPTWAEGIPIGPDAWRALRSQQPPCLVNDLFDRFPWQDNPRSRRVGTTPVGDLVVRWWRMSSWLRTQILYSRLRRFLEMQPENRPNRPQNQRSFAVRGSAMAGVAGP
jgi:hypothetical protein